MNKTTSLDVTGPIENGFDTILTDEALAFLADLARQFGPRVDALLAARDARQDQIDAGSMPNFLPATREIRESDWTVCTIPEDLADRHGIR